MPLPSWPHVPHHALAQRYLTPVLQFGVRAITLFAGRGIGKTAFILQDLIPLAQQHGFLCAYVDLWECPEGPMVGIARALESAAARGKTTKAAALTRTAKRLLPSSLKEVGADFEIIGHKASLKMGFNSDEPSKTQQGERLVTAFERITKSAGKRQILLVLDEAQTLASPKHDELVKALRGCFQRYEGHMGRVFTGSSRMGLERMFRRSRAPLFGQGGNVETFPPLGEAFVSQIASWFAERTGGAELGERAAYAGFVKLRFSARLFRAAVEMVLVGRAPTITVACQQVMHDLVQDHELKARLATLSALQWAVLKHVWGQGTDLFSANTVDGFRKEVGQAVEPPQIQTALKRLERLALIYRLEHGEYRIELAELELILENSVGNA